MIEHTKNTAARCMCKVKDANNTICLFYFANDWASRV